MELRYYFFLLQRWAWLLILGLVIGSGAAYFFSARQPQVYQTSTKIMVMRAAEEQTTTLQGYTYYFDSQLAKAYAQLIATEPVIELLSEKLGFYISPMQISAGQVGDTLVIQITVKDGDPERAAMIANELVGVFIEYNKSLQAVRYATAEQSLEAQIGQMEAQIAVLQEDIQTLSEESLTNQQQEVEAKLAALNEEITALKIEIAGYPDAPTPALVQALAEKQVYLDQLENTRQLYQQVYTNLLVMGNPLGSSDQNLRLSQIQTTLALYNQIYTNLLNNYENIRLARLRSTPNVVPIQQAQAPSKPIQPQPLRDGGLGGASGLLIMGILVFLIEYLDDTLKTPEDVLRALKLPVIGMIGEMDGSSDGLLASYVAEQPRSPVAEAYRALRTNLEFASVDKPLKTLLVTSVGPSEGKTTTAVNLAVIMAQGGKKVTLLDADLRRPSVHKFLHIPNRVGLTDLVRSQADGEMVSRSWGEITINVIPSGPLPPNPTELLGSARMAQILDWLKERSDFVIIDSPPSIVADPIVLAARVDGVMLVVQPGSTRTGAAQAMLEQFERGGARVVGVVLNPISRSRSYYYGKYQYYSQYYHYSSKYGNYYSSDNGRETRKNRFWKREKKLEAEVEADSEVSQSLAQQSKIGE